MRPTPDWRWIAIVAAVTGCPSSEWPMLAPPAASPSGTPTGEATPSIPTSAASARPSETAPVIPEPPAYTTVAGRAPESERTLGKLAALVADDDVTALAVAQIYGAVTPGEAFRTDLVIEEPFADASKLVLSRRRVQNRQYITAAQIVFRADVAPTISDVVARLGGQPPAGTVRLAHGCSHGPCPTYRTTVRTRGVDLVATSSIRVEGPVIGGRLIAPFQRRADPRATPVSRLRLEVPYGACPNGEPLGQSERVVLREATTERERLLVTAVESSTRAMGAAPVDVAAIERALGVTMPRGEDRFDRLRLPMGLEPHATMLGPHVEVRWWANAMSDHSELSVDVDDEAFPPLALRGLRYVDDPSRLCRMHRDGEHLYEPDLAADRSHLVEVRLRVRHPVSGGPPHLDHLSIRRVPRAGAP